MSVHEEVVRLAAEDMVRQREDIIRGAIIHGGGDPSDLEAVAKRGKFYVRPGVHTFVWDGVEILEFYTPAHVYMPSHTQGGGLVTEYYRKLY